MKNITRTVVLAIVLTVVVLPAMAEDFDFEARGDHYLVVSEVSQANADQMLDRMEAFLALYNRQFRFPVNELETPLVVRIFANQSRFDGYLQRLVDETRQGFVYLHYGDPAKSELVGYDDPGDDLEPSLIHQSFIQFLRTFVANPPLWIREGFAVHFEASYYDPEFGAAVYRENLAWLDTLKELVIGEHSRRAISLHGMLSLSVEEARRATEVFYPQAWGMVSFFLNSPRPETNRIIWDSISALVPDASLDENTKNVYNRVFRWVNHEDLTEEFVEYVTERRTFRGWIGYAIESFETGDLDEAERAFVQAASIRNDHYVPYYFLGLINYERENYGLADYYYTQALERGADRPIALYALGINAYADNRFDEAREYLELTVETDPDYRDRAERILLRIRG
jgi:tetratricopeptide (TPR) repeat protein